MEKKYRCMKCRTKFTKHGFEEWENKEETYEDKISVVCPKCGNNDKTKILGQFNDLWVAIKFIPDVVIVK